MASGPSLGPHYADHGRARGRISGYTSFLRDVEVTHRDDAFADGAIPDAYGLEHYAPIETFAIPLN